LADVKPGEERLVSMPFIVGNFARVNERGDTVLYEGTYCLVLDVPEQDKACFELTGGDVVLDLWPQPGIGNATRLH
jgi:beta-D-xylosidase 4